MAGRKPTWRREAAAALVFGLVLFGARSSLADHYIVPTGSMEYTVLPGDRVLVDKTAYGLRVPFVGWRVTDGARPHVGEIVVFDSPDDGKRLIKRIVAVSGDLVEVRGGRLVRNGQAAGAGLGRATEMIGSRWAQLNLTRGGGPDFGPQRVPEGQVLVVGDFRGNSHDGRMFGWIAESDVYGRGVGIFLRKSAGLTWRRL